MPTELIQPGEQVKLFDANSVAAPVNSAEFALPTAFAKYFSWTTRFASVPSAVDIDIEVSTDKVNWQVVGNSTSTAGETGTIGPTAAGFIRARKVSQTGAGAITLTLIMSY